MTRPLTTLSLLRHFSDLNAKAMDATWFKRAVDQHAVEPDSFVFSVPFDSGYNGKNSSVLVTAAHAMFIEHRGHKAAAAVIGLRYTHESLAKHFINITSTVRGGDGDKGSAWTNLAFFVVHGKRTLQENLCI